MFLVAIRIRISPLLPVSERVRRREQIGSNRADFSFIARGVVPGVLLLKPDFLENKEDWPFLWGENECVIDICADYIFLANAVKDLVNNEADK